MKKLAVLLLLALSTSAWAGGNYYHRHHRSMHQHYWVAPAIIGGVVTYALTRPQPVPPPVYYTQPYPAPQPQCTRYVYQDQYGNTLREEVRCN